VGWGRCPKNKLEVILQLEYPHFLFNSAFLSNLNIHCWKYRLAGKTYAFSIMICYAKQSSNAEHSVEMEIIVILAVVQW